MILHTFEVQVGVIWDPFRQATMLDMRSFDYSSLGRHKYANYHVLWALVKTMGG